MADNLTPLPVKTKTAGDVAVKLVDTGGINLLAVSAGGAASVLLTSGSSIVGKFGIDQTSAGVTNGVQVTGPGTTSTNTLFAQTIGVYNTSAPVLTNGNANVIQLDASANLKVNIAVALPTGANVIGAVTQSGTWNVTVNTALPTGANTIGNVGLVAGSAIVGKFGIDQSVAGTTNGVQITGPGTSTGNPIYVNTVNAVSVGTLKNSGQLTSAALGTGATVTLSTAAITAAKVASVEHIVASSTVPLKVEIQTINATSIATTVVTYVTSAANPSVDFKPDNYNEVQSVTADGTNAKLAVKFTNLDGTNAADVYAFIAWTEN